MRLQRFLSDRGICSRNETEALIRAGRIFINEKKAILGDKVSADDIVSIDGKTISETSPQQKMIVIFHKPKGVECTLTPVYCVKTLLDFDFGKERVFPIGGLDRHSSGLLLLTNDGELANRMAHPDNDHEEEYLLTSAEPLKESQHSLLSQSSSHGKKQILLTDVEKLEGNQIRCILKKGGNRQLAKLFEAAGVTLLTCQRIRIGTITVENIAEGKWRILEEDQFQILKHGQLLRKPERRKVPTNRRQ